MAVLSLTMSVVVTVLSRPPTTITQTGTLEASSTKYLLSVSVAVTATRVRVHGITMERGGEGVGQSQRRVKIQHANEN